MQSVRNSASRLTVGFTLIELMIVVAVVGILAMVAYPAFQQQVRESRHPEAHSALTALANDLEKFRSECGSYPPDDPAGITTIAGVRDCTTAGRGLNRTTTSTNGNYRLTLRTATAGGAPAGGYLLRATAQGQQAGDNNCQTFPLNNQGTTGATPGAGGNAARCWRR